MLHAMSLLHRSVIHYQVTYELHFWSGFKTSIIQEVFHVYLIKFENAVTHLFLVILGNN